MRKKLASLLLTLAIAFSAGAQQRPAAEAWPGVERLRAHVYHLASEKLEGRRTGTPGANMAAEYIAREFSRYGLKRSVGRDLPRMSTLEANSPRRYLQEFPYVAGVEVGKNSSMVFTPLAASTQASAQGSGTSSSAAGPQLDLRLGEDWMPLAFSSSAKVLDARAAFVGYGLKADELSRDDYAGTGVANRIAIAFAGTPDGDNPHGQFARYADVRFKAVAARNSGAAALVVIATAENLKDDRLAHLSFDNGAGEAGLPVVVVSRQVGARLLGLVSAVQLGEFERKLQELLKVSHVIPPSDQSEIKLTIKPPFDFTLSLSTDIVRRNAPAFNVVGILEGSDPVLKNEAIVLGAHYDHLGRGGSGSLAVREGEIHYGADDNASGVAALLELARIFSAERAKMKRTIIFIAFGGEEEGLLGSRFYINQPVVPLGQTVAMINMDMIGRMKEDRLMIGGVGTSSEWREMIAAANLERGMSVTALAPGSRTKPEGEGNPQSGMPVVVASDGQPIVKFDPKRQFVLTLNEDGYGPSDHSSFYARQVPVLFFFTGTHDDYHKPSDTAEKINYQDEARIIAFVATLVRSIDRSAKRPTYVVAKSQSQGRSMGFRVYLGTIPNYSEFNDGLKLDGVREDSPAAKAGLKAGDRIVKMAGRDVRNVYDYTHVLSEMRAGQEYEVEAIRGSATLRLRIAPTARK